MFGPESLAGEGFGNIDDLFGASGVGGFFDAFFGKSAANPFTGGFGSKGYQRVRQRGEDEETALDIDLSEATFGVKKDITVRIFTTCNSCNGSGARKGTTPTSCPTCHGSGQVQTVRRSFLGQVMTTSVCANCSGMGEVVSSPCPDCKSSGRVQETQTLAVEIPPGVDNGSTLRLSSTGSVGFRGGPPGDLYVHLGVREHPYLTRVGDELHFLLHIPVSQAAFGTDITFESLDGEVELSIPAGTQTGTKFRISKKGASRLNGRGRGDLIVEIVVDTPVHLNKEQEDLLRQFALLRGEAVAPVHNRKFISRLRS
jgi:molecular chaperone DnaJ